LKHERFQSGDVCKSLDTICLMRVREALLSLIFKNNI